MVDVFFAMEHDCEVVTEGWLKKLIGPYEPLPTPIPISEREIWYEKKFKEDTFLEEILAFEIASTDYKIGARCHHNDRPEPVYVITKIDILSHGNVSASIELVDNPERLPPESLLVMQNKELVNVRFLPSEEQQLFLGRYRFREVEEGIWKHRSAPSFISEMNRRLDRYAEDQVFDFVPGTHRKVRILVDPSLYAISRSIFSWSNLLVTPFLASV